jgi:hypothetical protein
VGHSLILLLSVLLVTSIVKATTSPIVIGATHVNNNISGIGSSNSGSDNDSKNNKDQPIKGGPIGICSIGVKSPCNGPVFDHP